MQKVHSKDRTSIAFDRSGQTHDVAADALAPVLEDFFTKM
jgi:hypothetical protein